MTSSKVPFVYILTSLTALSGFLFGYDTGVVSGAMVILDQEFSLSSTWHSSIVSITMAFAAIFSLLGGVCNSRFGRWRTTIISSVLFTLGSLFLCMASNKFMLLLGRAILGMAIGLSSMTAGMYVSECAPAEIRGKLVIVVSLAIVTGQFLAAFIDGLFSDAVGGWRFMFGFALAPCIIQLLGFYFFIPESPRWLIEHGREQEGKQVLMKIREEQYSEEEFENIREKVRNFEGRAGNFEKDAVKVGCFLQMFQQLSGINTIMYFSATIMQFTGLSSQAAIWDAAKLAFINMVGGFSSIFLIERLGRRRLILLSMSGVFFTLLLIANGMKAADVNSDASDLFSSSDSESSRTRRYDFPENDGTSSNGTNPQPITNEGSYNALIGMFLYLLFFQIGFGPVPWIVNSEIYASEYSRNIGNSLSTFTNWVFNFIVSMSMIPLSTTFGMAVPFYLCAVFTLISFIYVFLYLPETKGLPLEEIQRLFGSNKSNIVPDLKWCPKSVRRRLGIEVDDYREPYLAMQ